MNFETHITVSMEHREAATHVAHTWGWKTSAITDDPVLGPGDKFYLTSHGRDYRIVHNRLDMVTADLAKVGVPILREKIELIMFDTKGL